MRSQLTVCSLTIATIIWLPLRVFAELSAGYRELRGAWQATELVDNGHAVVADAISTWLPSGGRIEIVDNAMVFTSTKDGQRHARVFSIDATTYPRQINVIDNNQVMGHGIYRIEDGRLIVCISPAAGAARPTDFSARENSRRVLLVFARPKSEPVKPTIAANVAPVSSTLNLPPPPPLTAPAASTQTAKPLVNSDVAKLLPGTWTFNDAHGSFFLTLDQRGSFSTYRQSIETSAFQKVFKKLPLSSGTWKLNNGQVVLTCTSSIYPDRICKTFPFTIRSVNATSLDFVDYAGNAGKATRTTP